MNKLWAFGDSHIAGFGLGNYTHNEIQDWLVKKTGFDSYLKYSKSVGHSEKKEEGLLNKWARKLKKEEFPENSYAGRIAKQLNYNLRCKALSGSGIDYTFNEIIKNQYKIDWNNDIVLLNLPPVYRYISTNDERKQYALLDKRQYNIAPSLTTMENMYKSMYFYIRTYFPLIKIIHITDSSLFNEDLQKYCEGDNTIYIDDHARQFVNPNTPCGHWINELHEIFAKDLIVDLKL